MNRSLFGKAISKFLAGVVLIGFLLFLPAGTIYWWQGWLLMGILFVPMFVAGLVMMKKNPELLKSRLNAKEEQSEQRTVIALSGLMFLAAFIIWILENNTCAERLYHRMGFQKTGRRNYIAHGLDEIEMHLTGTFLQVTG